MKKLIHHMRRQPDGIKRLILHVLTVVFAFILVLLWVYSLGANVASQTQETKTNENLKPFSILKDKIVNGYNNLYNSNSSTEVNTQ